MIHMTPPHHGMVLQCRPQRPYSFTQLLKLLSLVLLFCLVAPSSALAITAKNCPMAESRHSAKDHGNPGEIIPTIMSTSTQTSIALPGSYTTMTTLIVPSLIRLSSTDSVVGEAISFSILTISPLSRDSLTSASNLHPNVASLGTIGSMPAMFTPGAPAITILSSTFASLEQSSSSSLTSTTTMSISAATASSSPSDYSTGLVMDNASILLTALAFGGGAIIFTIFICICTRRFSRRRKARAQKKEVELVRLPNSGNTRHAEGVLNDILTRAAPTPGQRTSLEDLQRLHFVTARARASAPATSPASAPERLSSLKTNDGCGNGGPPMHLGRSLTNPADQQWESAPPYQRNVPYHNDTSHYAVEESLYVVGE